jgi:hypothetical protein
MINGIKKSFRICLAVIDEFYSYVVGHFLLATFYLTNWVISTSMAEILAKTRDYKTRQQKWKSASSSSSSRREPGVAETKTNTRQRPLRLELRYVDSKLITQPNPRSRHQFRRFWYKINSKSRGWSLSEKCHLTSDHASEPAAPSQLTYSKSQTLLNDPNKESNLYASTL